VVVDELQQAKLQATKGLMGSFHAQETSFDKAHSPFANVSTDSDSAKSTSSINEA